MSNILTKDEIAELVNHSVVKANQEKLSNTNSVSFSISLPEPIKIKLETHFGIELTQLTIPMRWVKGDTAPHKDRGKKSFEKTCLVYLTDSMGEFVVDGQTYPIQAGDAHTFCQGVEHYTMNTGERLLIGPMSETGFRVGVPIVQFFPIYFLTDKFLEGGNPSGFSYTTPPTSSIYGTITMFGFPPRPVTQEGLYNIEYVNQPDWMPPPGKIFGGWKYWNYIDNSYQIGPIDSDLSKIYMPGETYQYSKASVLIPNWIDSPMRQFIPMHFSNNSMVYYKSHSLSTGGGGSGVRNARHKKRKT